MRVTDLKARVVNMDDGLANLHTDVSPRQKPAAQYKESSTEMRAWLRVYAQFSS